MDVVEIVPPYVQTELMGEQWVNPNAMPLGEFIDEVMSFLDAQPGVREVLVKRVLPLRFATEQGYDGYAKQFAGLNDHFAAK
ncbi:MAG TPA: hypothetical protein VNZ04_02700 [Trinickia sp.]|nr:hypothetical protein [Trinickia sp.]